jgi:hypothetical protein
MLPPLLILIPLIGIVFNLIWAAILAVVAEVMCVRWLVGFHEVRTPEVQRLRRHVGLFAFLAIVALAIALVVGLGMIFLQYGPRRQF